MTAREAQACVLSMLITSCDATPESSMPPASAWLAHLDAEGQLGWAADVARCWAGDVDLLAARPGGGWVGVGDWLSGHATLAFLDGDGSLLARRQLDSEGTVSALAADDDGAILALAPPGASPRVTRIGVGDDGSWRHDVHTEGVLISSIAVVAGGDILAIGAAQDADGDHDPWVSRLDAHGELLWETIVTGDEDLELLSGRALEDRIVVAGRRRAVEWETAAVTVLDLEGAVVVPPVDIGDLGAAAIVALEIAPPDGDLAILGNQHFETLLFERWRTPWGPSTRTLRAEWPDPWLVGTEMRSGPDGAIAVISPLLDDGRDGTWVRRIDGDGQLTADERLPEVGYGRAVAVGASETLIGGWTRRPHGTERCIRTP